MNGPSLTREQVRLFRKKNSQLSAAVASSSCTELSCSDCLFAIQGFCSSWSVCRR